MDRVTSTLQLLLLVVSAGTSTTQEWGTPFPTLSLLESAVRTTANQDFDGYDSAYKATTYWDQGRLRDNADHNKRAPYLACAEYGNGREAMTRLKERLSPDAVRFASHSSESGACFIATASYEEAKAISEQPEQFRLSSMGPFPSAVKLAPGLLDYNDGDDYEERLATTHGVRMSMANVVGLSIELAPGTLRMHSAEVIPFISTLLNDLTSKSMDLHTGNVWSDPTMAKADHRLTQGGARRAQEWTRAADVVHELSEAVGTSPSNICSWGDIILHQASDNVLIVAGALNPVSLSGIFIFFCTRFSGLFSCVTVHFGAVFFMLNDVCFHEDCRRAI